MRSKSITGAQALGRGLDILEGIAGGIGSIGNLASHLELTRSTTYRLVTTLVNRNYIENTSKGNYTIGRQLKTMGYDAVESESSPIVDEAGNIVGKVCLVWSDDVTLVDELKRDTLNSDDFEDHLRLCAQGISLRLGKKTAPQ